MADYHFAANASLPGLTLRPFDLQQGSLVGRFEEMVFAGWDGHYFVAKQYPKDNKRVTN